MMMERMWKANNVEISSPNCPRCGSSNTKFCYYNNYSSTQPRYFCKGCRRYWTKGGSLRNVPVGGGCRKSRRGKYTKTLRQANNIIGNYDDMRKASSSVVSDGPNIDLAQVYASFLNQKPDQVKTHAICYSSNPPECSNLLNTDSGHSALSEELGLTESHISESFQMYLCGSNTIHKHQEYYSSSYDTTNTNIELPPLPCEEAATSHNDNMWLSNSEMVVVDHGLQATQPSLFEPEAHDADFLLGNCWSYFDLPRDAAFFTP